MNLCTYFLSILIILYSFCCLPDGVYYEYKKAPSILERWSNKNWLVVFVVVFALHHSWQFQGIIYMLQSQVDTGGTDYHSPNAFVNKFKYVYASIK